MAHLLGAEQLYLAYPDRTILDRVTVGVNEGDRIGVVGRNGDGKSSLLRLLAGDLEPHGGRVTVRGGVRIGVLDQGDTLDPDATVRESVVGDAPEHEWMGVARIRDVLAGLLTDVPWEGRIGDLSGGQRRRTALAALLAQDDDALFLDEPTNHLDVEAITWLADHLKTRWSPNAGGLLVVTHDRWFLDEVCTATWEVHDGIVEPFEGGYAAYILQRVERDRMAAASESKRQNLMRKELAWLRRGAPARTAKPRFRIDAANALIADEPPVRDTVELSRLATARQGKDVVKITDASVSYGDHEVLRDLTWILGPGERTGILGVNGAGKSTLLRLITGEQQPTTGRVKHGKTAKVAQLTQELAELADLAEDRVSDVVGRYRTSYSSGGKDMTPGQLLERLGFTAGQLSTRVKDLSGGQRRRLQLLLILLDEPNLLILDEPSNDLDTDMLAAMEDLLDTWPGTLVVVSHDRYLLERVTDQQFAIFDGRLRHVPGGVDEYLAISRARSTGGSAMPGAGSGTAAGGASSSAAESGGLAGAERRGVQKELTATERKIANADKGTTKLHEQIAAHDQSDYVGLGTLTAELRALEAQIAELEERWLALSEQLG